MDNSIQQETFYVYVLIDDMDNGRPDGIFYVGFGRAERLESTIMEAKYDNPILYFNKKVQKIREMWEQEREPRLEIVFTSENARKARNYEDFLIQKYRRYLTNQQGITSKYPQYAFYEGCDPSEEDDDIPALMRLPEPYELISAINAAKEMHAGLDSDNSRRVMTFLLDLQEQFYPGMGEEEEPTELAKVTRGALMNSDSYLFKNIILRRMSVAQQNHWLDALAWQFIEISKQTQGYPGQSEMICEYFRERGHALKMADIFVLEVRFRRAGYIPED